MPLLLTSIRWLEPLIGVTIENVTEPVKSHQQHDPEQLRSYLEPLGITTVGVIVALFVPGWRWWGIIIGIVGLLLTLTLLGSLILVHARRRRRQRRAAAAQ